MPLPTHRDDRYAEVDHTNFSTAHELSRQQQLLLAEIAESRGDWESGSMWKSLAMVDAVAESEAANIAQGQGVPLATQPDAPEVPASPTTFNRQDPASRLIDEPARPPEAATGDQREFINQGTRQSPDAALQAQAARNAQLMAAQEASLRG